MICHRCLLRAARRPTAVTPTKTKPNTTSSPNVPSRRLFALSSSHRLAAAQTPATATAATTTTTNTSASSSTTTSEAKSPTPPPKSLSSVPAGTVLAGLNFYKNKPDPVALEDGEYPDWLWGVLTAKEGGAGEDGAERGDGEGDLFSKSKKQRRKAAKAMRRQQLRDPASLVPPVPLFGQTVDLPASDGTVEGAKAAGRAREDLTKAMRGERRRVIKESNFLKAMG